MLTVEVKNVGTDVLTVGAFESGDPAVTVTPASFALAAHASRTVGVTYAPASPGGLDTTLRLTSDASNTPTLFLPVRGTGAPAPGIGVDPSSFDETLLTGGTVRRTLTVRNDGGSDLVVPLTPELVVAGGAMSLPSG